MKLRLMNCKTQFCFWKSIRERSRSWSKSCKCMIHLQVKEMLITIHILPINNLLFKSKQNHS
jgi:hypothetical protein